MSNKSRNNLIEYNKYRENALKGIGNKVTVHQLRHILISYVDKEYAKLTDPQLVNHAKGGGFVINNKDNLFMMPLYDKNENKIDLSNEFVEPRVFLYEGKFFDANRTNVPIADYQGSYVFSDADCNKTIMHTWIEEKTGERIYSKTSKEKHMSSKELTPKTSAKLNKIKSLSISV
jgi:hypothetical protein